MNHPSSSSSGPDSSAAERTPPEAPDLTLAEAAEAIIFAADAPVSSSHIARSVAEVTGREPPSAPEVDAAVEGLNDTYAENGRALRIKNWADGYRMVTRSSLAPFVKAYYVDEQETTLSRSLMEALAVIAYRQPVTRPEVDFVRGVNSDYAIRKLMEMDLIHVDGRADSVGRPLLYSTTDRFLEQFGLESLQSLPTLREVQDLLDDPDFDEERAQLLQLDREEGVSVDLLDEDSSAPTSEEADAPD